MPTFELTPNESTRVDSTSLNRRVSAALQAILALEVIVALWQGQWLTALTALGIIVLMLVPLLVARKWRLYLPPQFQLLAVVFVFAALFLGEVRGYYLRFWWWDLALHTASGGLLGIFGFLMVYVLNESDRVGLHMKPGFIAFFAFLFALGVGALWEVFEFLMDASFGMNMQKAMLGDDSGLTDTMFDLIVDILGAAVISLYGYWHLRSPAPDSFIESWIAYFLKRNRHHFRRGRGS